MPEFNYCDHCGCGYIMTDDHYCQICRDEIEDIIQDAKESDPSWFK